MDAAGGRCDWVRAAKFSARAVCVRQGRAARCGRTAGTHCSDVPSKPSRHAWREASVQDTISDAASRWSPGRCITRTFRYQYAFFRSTCMPHRGAETRPLALCSANLPLPVGPFFESTNPRPQGRSWWSKSLSPRFDSGVTAWRVRVSTPGRCRPFTPDKVLMGPTMKAVWTPGTPRCGKLPQIGSTPVRVFSP